MNPLSATFSARTENLLLPGSSTKASESSVKSVDLSQTIVSNPEAGIQETKEVQKFQAAISDAKNSGKEEDKKNNTFGTRESTWYGAAVHTYSEEEYSVMRLFLSANALYGFALKDTDIVSVFKHKNEKVKALDIIMPKAIAMGGKRLDCFSIRTVLPFMYSKYGFIAVAKVKFDETQAPEDWNYARDGTPDIIFMVYSKNAAENVEKDPLKLKLHVENQISMLPYSLYEDAIDLQKKSITKNQ